MDSGASDSDPLIKYVAWFSANKARVALVGVVVVLAVVGAVLYLQYEGGREARAARALSDAASGLFPTESTPPGMAERLLQVADDFPTSKAASRAILTVAGIYFSDGKYAEAQTQFERVLQEHRSSPWAFQAGLGVAKSLDAQGKSAEARAKYEEVRQQFADSPVVDEASLAIARIDQGAGQEEEAFKLYHTLTETSSGTIAARASMRKALMVKENPQLTNSLAPLIPPMTVMPTPSITTTFSNAPAAVNSNVIQVIPQRVATPGAPNAGAPNAPVLPPVSIPGVPDTPQPQGGTEPLPPENLPDAPPPVPEPEPADPPQSE